MTEAELIEGCRRGNNLYRRKLYELYSPKMTGICYRYTGNEHTALDLLHDGFLKVFKSFNSFTYRGEGSLRAWMSKVFTNTCLEYLRKKHAMNGFIALDECYEYVETLSENDMDVVPDAVLAHFIAELPPGYRTVFNLYAFENMSHKEISDVVGISESASRSQLSRAKNALSEKVKKYIHQHE